MSDPRNSARRQRTSIALKWTKRSSPPPDGVIKPKPFSSLNHLTTPCCRLLIIEIWREKVLRCKGRLSICTQQKMVYFVKARGDSLLYTCHFMPEHTHTASSDGHGMMSWLLYVHHAMQAMYKGKIGWVPASLCGVLQARAAFEGRRCFVARPCLVVVANDLCPSTAFALA